ncbi:UbiA family prenyltransferase [Variovorax sp. PBL-E5]|uniref:UbiA family prenyltransferase n=1 Tax=Variovorax sp. PBL-E5 TaxID=434014 RepID=UPI001318E3FC|nr:UbiA family prenyltransferase [Variovorax sp. PBL-E5]VTU24755.1 Decaprenyl-phosphate phosphoribosyltransferase [Variovorax sp. PBL-E5]
MDLSCIPPMVTAPPLYVDLDGTLIASDLLIESALVLVKQRPLAIFDLLGWILQGKATLKTRIAQEVELDVAHLPYDHEVLALIARARSEGRKVVLATASHRKYADAVAAHLRVFDAVLATDSQRNRSGLAKLEAIQADADGPFCYAGNSAADLPIWQAAESAIVVTASPALVRRAAARARVDAVVRPAGMGIAAVLRAMRLHQWVKNLLVFMPAVPLAAQLGWPAVWTLLLAFFCFGLCASSVYLLNDLLDIDADRQHPTKSRRPIPSGAMPLAWAVMLTPILLLAAFGLAAWRLPWLFAVVLVFYWALTMAYSVRLKRITVVDVLLLAGLYTMRILAGAAVIGVIPSFWILAFSMFLFFSLASAKRYIELADAQRRQKMSMAGRGYNVADIPVVLTQGIAAGQIAVMVFALYIQDPVATQHFRMPYFLWGVAPLLLYWISRLWMKALRAKVHDDPLVFAVKDRQSQVIGTVCAGLIWGAL